MKKILSLFGSFLTITATIMVLQACVKDLEKEEISDITQYIGKVVEKSTMQPVEGVSVQVTDGSHVHAMTTTDKNGHFILKDINFDEIGDDCYLWFDGTSLGLPSKQEPLLGLGNKVYDYKNIILYDETNVNLLPQVNTSEITDILALSAKVAGNVTADGGHEVTSRGICYATHQTPTLNDSVITAGSGLGEFSVGVSGLISATTYYVRAYATNSISTTYGAQMTFTTQNGGALLSIIEASNITATSATISGSVNSDGGDIIIARGFCYAKAQEPTINDSITIDGADTGAFTHTLRGLETNTTYYYRAYATNACMTSYSPQGSFTTTNGLPILTTTAISNITGNSAKGGGEITANGGFIVNSRGLCWNTTGEPNINDSHTTNGYGNGIFNSNLSELQSGVTYYVRAYATNSKGTGYGNEVSFTTLSGNVTLTTTAISNVTAISAQSGGNITNNGGLSIIARGVCWNTTGNPNINDSHTTNGSGNGTFNSNLTELAVNTTYHVRAYATNQNGTYYGNDIVFTTSNGKPNVTTGAVSNVNATMASCSGNVLDDGGFAIISKGFCWGTSPNPTINNNHIDLGNGTGVFNGSLTGLTMNTTYYVRAYATNSIGTTYGTSISFTSGNGLPVVETSIVERSDNKTMSGGHIISDGGFPVTKRGICYGIYPDPDLTSTFRHTEDGSGLGYYTSVIDPSLQGTFYVRAYATNANETVYGNQVVVDYDYLSLPTFVFNGHTYKVAPDPYVELYGSGNTRSMSWSDANSYCQNLTAYGYYDWRLPTIEELQIMYIHWYSIGGFSVVYESGSSFNRRYFNIPVYHSSTSDGSGAHYKVIFDGWHMGTLDSPTSSGEEGGTAREKHTSSCYYLYNYQCKVRPIRIDH